MANYNPVTPLRRQGLKQRSRRILAITMLLLYLLSALYWINVLVGILSNLHDVLLLADLMESHSYSFAQCVLGFEEADSIEYADAVCRDVMDATVLENVAAIVDRVTAAANSRATRATTISSIAFALSVCSSITIFMGYVINQVARCLFLTGSCRRCDCLVACMRDMVQEPRCHDSGYGCCLRSFQ